MPINLSEIFKTTKLTNVTKVVQPQEIPNIQLSASAVTKLKELMLKDGFDPTKDYFRFGVKGGGCSSMSYTLDFSKHREDEDILFEFGDLHVLVDPCSLVFINGTELNWLTGLKAGWEIKNPKSTKSCSCGTSFSI